MEQKRRFEWATLGMAVLLVATVFGCYKLGITAEAFVVLATGCIAVATQLRQFSYKVPVTPSAPAVTKPEPVTETFFIGGVSEAPPPKDVPNE